MGELFKSLKEDFEKALAFWMLNNMDLIQGYINVKYSVLAYLKMGRRIQENNATGRLTD